MTERSWLAAIILPTRSVDMRYLVVVFEDCFPKGVEMKYRLEI